MHKDVRIVFDDYIVGNSQLWEIVEVLQYTYIYGSRCLGEVLRVKAGRKAEIARMTYNLPPIIFKNIGG